MDRPPETEPRMWRLRLNVGRLRPAPPISIVVSPPRPPSASVARNVSIARGVTGLIWPNRACTTSAVNPSNGFLERDGGEIMLRGQSIGGRKPHVLVEAGVARPD